MQVEIVREYRFEAAHRLTRVPPDHKCARLHGHSYKIEFVVCGPVDPETGWFIDFAILDAAVRPHIDRLDHYYLNEIEGLDNPTSENLARWLWERVITAVPQLTSVTVSETCDARCVYRGG